MASEHADMGVPLCASILKVAIGRAKFQDVVFSVPITASSGFAGLRAKIHPSLK